MERRPGSRVLLAVFVVGILASAALPAGAAIRPSEQPLSGVDQQSPATAAADRQWSSPVATTGQAENELHVEMELSVAPDNTGTITVEATVRNPDDVVLLGIDSREAVTVLETEGFERRGGEYRWDGRTDRPSFTYHLAVNESTDAFLGAGVTAADTGEWAILSPPRAPVSYAPGVTRIRHGQTAVVESYTVAGEGVVTDGFVYLGPYRSYETWAGDQTIRLVVPLAAAMADDPRRVLETLTNASREIRIGGRDETVTGLVAPSTVDWAISGTATGPRTFWVRDSARVRTAGNVWIHEYVHTRESIATGRSMAWLTEALATYYAAEASLRQRLIGFDEFRSTLEQGTTHTSVRLANRSTWDYESDYQKGALVLGRLDLRIRAASDGDHTLADAIRRLQRHDGTVDAETFARAVANVSSPGVGEAARRYVTTTATPEPWTQSVHERRFGYETARFEYEFRNPRAVGPNWTRNLTAEGSPLQLLPGERLVVDGVVRNDGDAPGEYDVTFRTTPREAADRRRVSGYLPAGWTWTHPFAVSVGSTDRFVAVFGNNPTAQLSVAVVEPVRNVTVESVSVTSQSVDPGGTVSVTATIHNPAERPARATVPVTVDGRRVGTETVVLGSDSTTEVTTTVTLDAAGISEVGVGKATVSVRVGTVTSTTTPTETFSEPRTTGPGGQGSGPGLGAGAAGLAIWLAAALLSTRDGVGDLE